MGEIIGSPKKYELKEKYDQKKIKREEKTKRKKMEGGIRT